MYADSLNGDCTDLECARGPRCLPQTRIITEVEREPITRGSHTLLRGDVSERRAQAIRGGGQGSPVSKMAVAARMAQYLFPTTP